MAVIKMEEEVKPWQPEPLKVDNIARIQRLKRMKKNLELMLKEVNQELGVES